jgi:cysteinyl-tRNA synthetase
LNHHYRYPWECFPEDLVVATETVALFQQVRTMVSTQSGGEDRMLRDRFIAAMDSDLNTPEAFLLLRQAAETAVAKCDVNLGAEILKLVKVLGLRV